MRSSPARSPRSSRIEATRFGGLEITFRVEQVWKGDPQRRSRCTRRGAALPAGTRSSKVRPTSSTPSVTTPTRCESASVAGRRSSTNAKEDLSFLGKPSHEFDSGKRAAALPLPAARWHRPRVGSPCFCWGRCFVMRRSPRRPRCRSAGCVALGLQHHAAKPSLMANMAKEEVTVYQLRAMDYEYAASSPNSSRRASWISSRERTTRAVREHAYQWRMWAMPQARAAAFDQDPFAGLIELWVLSEQQRPVLRRRGGTDASAIARTVRCDTTSTS